MNTYSTISKDTIRNDTGVEVNYKIIKNSNGTPLK